MSMTTTTAPSPLSYWDAPSYLPSSPNPLLGNPAASSPTNNESSNPGYFNLPHSSSAASSSSSSRPYPPAQSARAVPDHADPFARDIAFTRSPNTSTLWPAPSARTPLPHKPNNAERRPSATPQQQQRVQSPVRDISPRPTLTSSPQQLPPERRPSRVATDPPSFQGAAVPKHTDVPARAETSPARVDQGGVKLISAHDCVQLLSTLPGETLLLDVRSAAQHGEARIKSSLNLCIPTTLLKRPSFNLHKVQCTLGSDAQKQRLQEWQTSTHIVVYDAATAQLRNAQTLVSVLQKFTNEGFKGQPLILRGGFHGFSKELPNWVDSDPISADISPSSSTPGARASQMSLSINIADPSPSAPHTLGSKSSGHQQSSTAALGAGLCRSIRQNTDLVDGVGQIPLHLPPSMTEAARMALPKWLREASEALDTGKQIADKFLAIEKSEQSRMQEALGDSSMYSPSGGKLRNKTACRIAGIEKGLKNRYSNIYPYEHTRVRLQNVTQDSCDYINASHAKSSRSNRRYIATQAPLPATFNDFWRVVWEQDVRVIVMLTAESEGPQRKCHPYWDAGDYGPLQVQQLGERSVPLDKKKQAPMKKQKTGAEAEDTPQMRIRHLSLAHTSQPFRPLREITLLQYSDWPDFGAPAEPSHLLRLVAECDQAGRQPSASDTPKDPFEPASEDVHKVLVHCSAGCGRTGTFCTVDSVIDLLKRQRWERRRRANLPRLGPSSPSFFLQGAAAIDTAHHVDSDDSGQDSDWLRRDDDDLIAATVEEFRTQRPNIVQSLTQFALCYESVLEWVAETSQ